MIPGFKLLLQGPAGTGKTYSTRTLFDLEGITPFHLFLEQSQTTIGDKEDAHYAYISPSGKSVTWDTLKQMGKKINTMDNAGLQGSAVGNRRDHTQWLEMIDILNNFTDQNGEEFGDVLEWGTDRALVIDGLTGITRMARGLTAGMRPLLTQPDYGVVMFNIASFLNYLIDEVQCHFVLIAHVEKERDEVAGGMSTMVSTIGRKLAPTIPPMFDDVVLAKQTGTSFIWSVVEDDTTVKSRNLPLKDDMEQDFGILLDAWRGNGGIIAPGKGVDLGVK